MASAVISSRRGGGHLGSGDGATTNEIYYCFDCDRNLTIIATSDAGLICPICGHIVLEEFESPFPPPPPPPPTRSTTLIDPQSFFPTSDSDSDVELTEPLRPPPPPVPGFFLPPVSTSEIMPEIPRPVPPPPSSSRSVWDWEFVSDRLGHLRPPSPPPPPLPSVSVIGRRRPPCPELPTSSAPPIADYFLSLPEEDLSEVHTLQPPLPPPLPPEHLLLSPPRSPSASSEVSEPFYSPERDPPNPPPPETTNWNYFFLDIEEPELNTSNLQRPSELVPPPPPPWLQSPSMEGLLDMSLTKDLVSEWECHQCSICIDTFELNQKVKLTPCNHLYHSDCILRWLDLHKSCPVCRSKLPSH